MANLLNNIIANQPINQNKKKVFPEFSTDAKGKVEPMADKGKLLPSRIFGSPIEYAKDLKQDIVNIGRAAKGKANDHELGRINDVAMKFGSAALAIYLFSKGHIAKNKAMEIIGAGTFFASMALWPKLAIQLPIKLRTGVDVHQKYEDSQGRKKMMFQDPQYDLTDLYSRKDLDKIGRKMNVSEELPDRDSFIKQRAKKTATQANTLWMMTAGVATPIMSALACNALEEPVSDGLGKLSLMSTENALKNLESGKIGFFDNIRRNMDKAKIERFFKQHANDEVDDKLIKQIISLYSSFDINDGTDEKIIESFKEYLGQFKATKDPVSSFRSSFAKALENLSDMGDDLKKALDCIPEEDLVNLIKNKNGSPEAASKIVDLLEENYHGAKDFDAIADKLTVSLSSYLGKVEDYRPAQKLSDVGNLKEMNSTLVDYFGDKRIIRNFVNARVGNIESSFFARTWNKLDKKLAKALKFSQKELNEFMYGVDDQSNLATKKLEGLASKNPKRFTKLFKEISLLLEDLNKNLGEVYNSRIKNSVQNFSARSAEKFRSVGLEEAGSLISSASKQVSGSQENLLTKEAAEKAVSGFASFNRLLKSLTVSKLDEAQLKSKLMQAFANNKLEVPQNIDEITKLCKKIVLDTSMNDHSDKFLNDGLCSAKEYKIIMEYLYGNDSPLVQSHKEILKQIFGDENIATRLTNSLKNFQDKYFKAVVDRKVDLTAALEKLHIGADTKVSFDETFNYIGKKPTEYVAEVARKTFNSSKWMKMFGGTMAGLTAVTLVAGLFFGKKSKMEKQVEAESIK